LKDPTVIQLYDKKIVLTHGDKLCTLDKKYQIYRRIIQNSWIKKLLLMLPLSYRKKLAKKLRQKSSRHGPPPTTRPLHWDVVFEDVCKILLDHKANMVVHGHTHQPKIKDFFLNNQPYKHIILGEWDKTGSVLKISRNNIELSIIT
jgi:UDP-2,3-diacylglucosamine hydrolase